MLNPQYHYDQVVKGLKAEIRRAQSDYTEDLACIEDRLRETLTSLEKQYRNDDLQLQLQLDKLKYQFRVETQGSLTSEQLASVCEKFEPMMCEMKTKRQQLFEAHMDNVRDAHRRRFEQKGIIKRELDNKLAAIDERRQQAYADFLGDLETYQRERKEDQV